MFYGILPIHRNAGYFTITGSDITEDGLYLFVVATSCDTSNNTAEVIDRNEFVGDIYIKPARTISFIKLNFVAVRTGVEFNEIIGSV